MNRADVRWRWWAVVPAASLVAMVALPPTAAPVAAQGATPPSTVRFDATGQPQTWLVPVDVHQATFTVAGARGGDSELYDGAYGGTATTSIAVTPGETLHIFVGGRGADWESYACGMVPVPGGDEPTGGFNGGGNGGGGPGCHGGGGGGASDVRRGGSGLDNQVIVAGGGGGAASSCRDAGGGGGLVGGSAGCGGGAGGNQNGSTGSGERGQGGTGGDPSTVGSGGGGGFYGGAGGGENLGGGGGSGDGPAATVFETGVNPGPGFVTISFTADAPTVSGVTPNFGPERGGAETLITGSGFQPAGSAEGVPTPAVYFGTAQADPRQVSCTETECRVAAPPGTGTVNVRVEVAGQMSLDSPADDYTYFGDPTLTGIDPPTAWAARGLHVVGTNFPPPPYVTEVWFGQIGPVPTFGCISSTECSVDIPPGLGLGHVDVTVVTPQGRSNSVQFTLVPGVEQVSPPSGQAAGGTTVELTGTNFDTTLGHTIIHFGDKPVEATGCSSTTRCLVITPASTGTVWVNATVDGWQSLEQQGANQFTYTAGAGEAASPIPVDVRFDEDSTALRPEDEPFLRSIATALQAAPPTATVTVEGHADSTGPADYNDDLSQRRAQVVTDWLVGTGGVAADRITAVAHGELMPIASNDDTAGRAVNRRVTITVA